MLSAVVVVSCAAATARTAAPPFGYTSCATVDGVLTPLPYVLIPILRHEEGEAVIAHEIAHATVMLAFADCRSYEQWLRNGGRLQTEAIAFCASAEVAVNGGRMSADSAFAHYGRWLSGPGYNFRLTPDSAAALIRDACRSSSISR